MEREEGGSIREEGLERVKDLFKLWLSLRCGKFGTDYHWRNIRGHDV